MFFVYLRDGRRVDVPDAASVMHRVMVVFLNEDEQVVEQLPADDIIAYSRSPYERDEPATDQSSAHGAVPQPLESDLLQPRRHRRQKPPADGGEPQRRRRRTQASA